MRKHLLTIGVGLVLSGLVMMSGMAAPAGLLKLHGHVPLAAAHLQAKGRLAATSSMTLAIGLPLRNQAELTNLLQQLYDPSSPNYRQFLTPEEFTARFGPTEQDYQAVTDFAKANGLTVVHTHPNRMLVDVTGKVSDIERTFHVTMRTYRHPKEARDFFAPDTEPSVDAGVPLLHVSGLDNYAVPRPMLHKKPAAYAKTFVGSSPGNGYIGTDFRKAYVPGTTLTGSNQMVGLFQIDSGFYQSDITAYETQAGLPNVPVQAVLLDGYTGGPGFANDEVSLDIEMVISMAPGVSKVLVFEGSVTDDILNSMASSNQVKQLSASWSYPIDSVTEQIYQQFAAQGQSFFNASGDFDSWAAFGFILQPCDDPYITIVGGTTLTTVVTNGPWTSETVWNWGGGIGSGGGISSTYLIPSWQTNINMTTNLGSATFRNIPDVALTADNVFVVFGGGLQGIFGGTSASSPLWAGYMALVNQQVVKNGKPPIGFLNPYLYALAQTPGYTNYFHDITTGNNTSPGSPTQFFAVPGYDLCTGLGTPNGTNLIFALAGNAATHASAPNPPVGGFSTNLAALIGSNPNGQWELFIEDLVPVNSGKITNGWTINLTTANPVGLAADAAITMTNSASSIAFGSNVVCTLAVTNYGPSASTNVFVTDSLPLNTTLVSSNATLGSVVTSGSQLFWNLGPLDTNAGAQLSLTFHPNVVGIITNTAVVTSVTPDPNPDDNAVGIAVGVGLAQPLQISGSFIHSGGGGFALTILNASPSQTYVVQASTNLINWADAPAAVIISNSPLMIMDSKSSNYPTRYYRVRLGP